MKPRNEKHEPKARQSAGSSPSPGSESSSCPALPWPWLR